MANDPLIVIDDDGHVKRLSRCTGADLHYSIDRRHRQAEKMTSLRHQYRTLAQQMEEAGVQTAGDLLAFGRGPTP